jgi:flagellar hook-basal body complex protein FliE
VSINAISLAGAMPQTGVAAAPSSVGSSGAPFGNLLERVLDGAVQSGTQADSAVRDLAVGRTDSFHEVMLQVAQADLSFRLVLEIRNRLTEAYQEIAKMQF